MKVLSASQTLTMRFTLPAAPVSTARGHWVWRGTLARTRCRRMRAGLVILRAYRRYKVRSYVREVNRRFRNVRAMKDHGRSVKWPAPPKVLRGFEELLKNIHSSGAWSWRVSPPLQRGLVLVLERLPSPSEGPGSGSRGAPLPFRGAWFWFWSVSPPLQRGLVLVLEGLPSPSEGSGSGSRGAPLPFRGVWFWFWRVSPPLQRGLVLEGLPSPSERSGSGSGGSLLALSWLWVQDVSNKTGLEKRKLQVNVSTPIQCSMNGRKCTIVVETKINQSQPEFTKGRSGYVLSVPGN
ncbi:unnamed protein product [Arctogadus glacialis]